MGLVRIAVKKLFWSKMVKMVKYYFVDLVFTGKNPKQWFYPFPKNCKPSDLAVIKSHLWISKFEFGIRHSSHLLWLTFESYFKKSDSKTRLWLLVDQVLLLVAYLWNLSASLTHPETWETLSDFRLHFSETVLGVIQLIYMSWFSKIIIVFLWLLTPKIFEYIQIG